MIRDNKTEDIIRLSTAEWYPYISKDLPNYGCDAQIVSEAFALEGIRVEYIFMPWARGYYEAETGLVDGAIEWMKLEEREVKFYFSEKPYNTQENIFLSHRDNPLDWETLDDLIGKKIGITVGYGYGGKLDELLANPDVIFETASSDEANIRKLLDGRIDVFPIERTVGEGILTKYFSTEERDQIILNPKPLSQFYPYVILTKALPENQERIEKYNRGFETLVNSGRYQKILETCFSEDS